MDEFHSILGRNLEKIISNCALLGIVTISTLLLEEECKAQSLSRIRSSIRSEDEAPIQSSSVHTDRSCDQEERSESILGFLIQSCFFENNSRNHHRNDGCRGTEIDYEIYSHQAEEVDCRPIRFQLHPYASSSEFGLWTDASGGNRRRYQASVWYGTDLEDIESWNGQIRIDNQLPLGFDFQWSHLSEKLQPGLSDSLDLLDCNLTWRLLENPVGLLRAGAGVQWLNDRFGTEAGYNLTMSAEWFPIEPWIFSFELDHGELGESHQTHLLATVGWQFKHAELLTGFEYRKVGPVEIGGPLLGLRFWW